MRSPISPPAGAWDSQLTAAVCASPAKLGAPQVSALGTTIYPRFSDGSGSLLALVPGAATRSITGACSPLTNTLGNADFDISPDGGSVAYVAGDGRIVCVRANGGPVWPLLAGGGISPRFCPTGPSLAAITGLADGPAVVLVDLEHPDQPRLITPPTPLLPTEVAWFPDGNRLAVVSIDPERMPWDSGQLQVIDLADGRCETLVPPSQHCHVGSPRPSPDGQSLVFITDRNGWLNLWQVDLASGRCGPLLAEPREHLYPAWSPNGTLIAFVSRAAGDYRLSVLDMRSGQVERLHDIPGVHGTWFMAPGISVAWTPDGANVVTTYSSPTSPVEIGSFPLDGSPPHWLTNNGLPAGLPAMLQPPREVTWERGGLALQGWLHLPVRNGAYPLAVHVHGGPTGDAALWWFYPIPYLVGRGWAVLDVNYRGSVGFGRAFLDALIGGWGEEEVADIAAGVEACRDAAPLSGTAVIFGISAGAYTAAMSCISRPDVYRAGACLSGLYDLTRISGETVPALTHYLKALLGGPHQVGNLARERSPLYRAADLSRPLLILHGETASATPLAQAEQFARALEAEGKAHQFKVIKDEAYGGTLRRTTIEILESIGSFFMEVL